MKRSPADGIHVQGAREHNLRNISLSIPRSRFVVITGVSGSGKSTLAFDILFNEGQRRFLDSMGAYARQFVEQMPRPDVDRISGLPPTVSIEQNTSRGGGKSTVATVTEIHHFVRLLYAKLGTQYCPDCQIPVRAQTRDELRKHLLNEARRRGELQLLAPVVRNRKGFHSDVAQWAARQGYSQVRADGRYYDPNKPFRLDRFREHDVEIVVGTLRAKGRTEPTIRETVDTALKLGRGTLFAIDSKGSLSVHSTERACPKCNRSFQPLDPKQFSYNSSQGWCPKCRGFGELFWMPEDVDRGERADAIEETWWRWQEGEREPCPECHGARLNPISCAVRLGTSACFRRPAGSSLIQTARTAKGSNNSRSRSSESLICRRDTNSTLVDPTIVQVGELNVATSARFFEKLKFTGREAAIARDILPEITTRLKFLEEVGLGYLQLHRSVPTLSGGESQRIRLAAQLGSNMSGVLYVLDEPTIGLHARDNHQLINVLHRLRSRGNSIVVVEHDEDTMRAADYIVDLGPGAGVRGGNVIASGTLPELLRHKDSITGNCLRAQEARTFPTRGKRRPVQSAASVPLAGQTLPNVKKKKADSKTPARGPRATGTSFLTLHRAGMHNLKNLTVRFPLNRFVCVTGVSGSGKSTLIRDCLLPELSAVLKRKGSKAKSNNVTGAESLASVHEVDQSPIGRTPRSVPATYVGFFDDIRKLFSQVPEARMRGYGPGRFSFNSPQGRCPECQGAGVIKLEMNFLPPAFVRCETCQGTRFNPETLDVQFNGKNISQVLEMSVEEALGFFAAQRRILRPLQALHDTGLDYLKLGQTSPTLSGGEAQRVKLVSHLLSGLRPGSDDAPTRGPLQAKRNLFILEEPTIGLHMADIQRLVEVLQRLVDAGHSVIVIEHNLELAAESDWVIDLGPEGGDAGGRIVAEGTPEQIARNRRSHTGRFLRKLLSGA